MDDSLKLEMKCIEPAQSYSCLSCLLESGNIPISSYINNLLAQRRTEALPEVPMARVIWQPDLIDWDTKEVMD